ncbi:MAG: Spy0128 family protein [Lachnospiraceae bacterium]
MIRRMKNEKGCEIMGVLKNIREKQLILFGMLLVIMLPMLFPQSANAASMADVTLEVEQVFTKPEDSNAADTFTYTLMALESSNPMPVGSSGNTYTFPISGTDKVELGTITCSTTGTYSYEITQSVSVEQTGYTYDTQVYTVWVYAKYVDGDLKTEVVVINDKGVKVSAITFANTYAPLTSDPDIMVDPAVKKTVNGTPSEDGTFIFKLEAENKSNPMPTGSEDGVKLMTIMGEGEEDFGTWSYTEIGTYHYTVSELNNDESGYTYDTTIYTITDLVTDADGQLEVTRTVTNVNNEPVDSYDFVNQYTSDAEHSGITGTGATTGGTSGNTKGVKTGDDTRPELYLILLIIGVMVLLAYISYKVRKKIEANQEKI